jgi:hypothetical protein
MSDALIRTCPKASCKTKYLKEEGCNKMIVSGRVAACNWPAQVKRAALANSAARGVAEELTMSVSEVPDDPMLCVPKDDSKWL